jgi:outer membrane protein
MKTFSKTCVAIALLLASFSQAEARQWTLGDCVNYALANNISLKKTKVQQLTALEDVKQKRRGIRR